MPHKITGFALALMLVAPLLGGCHMKFKKHAPQLNAVETKVIGVRQPTVNLGGTNPSQGNGLLDEAVAIYQMGKEAEIERKMFTAVDPDAVQWALEDGVANGLGDGPPFAWTDDEGRNNMLQLEVLEYGIDVPSLGASGNFEYRVRMRIYTTEAKRVYNAKIRCLAPIGNPEVFARAFGGVNNVRQIKNMSDEQIQAAYEDMAKYCGERIVAKMRRHAG